MRRLREAGIVTLLLLGLTGCAGVQQRLGWTEPPYLGDEGSEDRPLSRLAFWRRHRADETVPAATAPASADPGRSNLLARNATSPSVADEERPGLLRRLPLVGRLWKDGDRGESDEIEMPAARFTPPPVSTAATGFVPPRSPAAATAAPTQAADATPAPSTVPAAAPAPATAALQPHDADEEPLRELSVELVGTRPQVDSAAVPARNANPDAPPPVSALPEATQAPANAADPQPQQRTLPSPPVPSLGNEDAPPPTATPGGQPDLSPVPSRAPTMPSTTTNDSAPASGSSWTSTVVSTPGPVWSTSGPSTYAGSVQSIVTTSAQGSYVGGGCDEPCGAKCKVHKLCPFKKHKQSGMVVSDYSPVVLPSAQGVVSSCGGTCKVKKPCFLKTWLHHKSGCKIKGCKGCKKCSYCGEPATIVSSQGPIVSGQ